MIASSRLRTQSSKLSFRGWAVALGWVLVALLGLYTAALVIHAVRMAVAPGEQNYAEGTWLFAALRVRYGLTPYFDYSHAPYVAMVYSPLAPEIAGWLGGLVGASDHVVIALARLLSLASALATALAIYLICRAVGVARVFALLAGLLFLTPTHIFQLWSFVARGDLPAVALGLWSMYVVVRIALSSPKWWSVLLAGVLMGLAVAAKQSAVAPLIAGGWWLLTAGGSEKRRRWFPVLLAGAVAGFILPIVLLGIESIRPLIADTIDLARQPWSLITLQARLDNLVSLFGLVIPLSLLGLVRHATPAGPRWLLARYAAVAALVFVLTSGKIGSASSYCLELFAALAVLAGWGLQWLLERLETEDEDEVTHRETSLGLLALVFVPLALQTALAVQIAQNWRDLPPDDRPLQAMVGTGSDPVLSENGYIVLNGTEPPLLLDPFYFSMLSVQNRWDTEPVRRMLAEKRIKAVVLTHLASSPPATQGAPWLPDTWTEAINDGYQLKGQSGRYFVYVPKP